MSRAKAIPGECRKPDLHLMLTGATPGPRGNFERPCLAAVTTKAGARRVARAEKERREKHARLVRLRQYETDVRMQIGSVRTCMTVLQRLLAELAPMLEQPEPHP